MPTHSSTLQTLQKNTGHWLFVILCVWTPSIPNPSCWEEFSSLGNLRRHCEAKREDGFVFVASQLGLSTAARMQSPTLVPDTKTAGSGPQAQKPLTVTRGSRTGRFLKNFYFPHFISQLSPIHWLAVQISAIARAGSGWSQEPGTSYGGNDSNIQSKTCFPGCTEWGLNQVLRWRGCRHQPLAWPLAQSRYVFNTILQIRKNEGIMTDFYFFNR